MIDIISISGKKRHGKNLLANYIQALIIEKKIPNFFTTKVKNDDLSGFLNNSNAFYTAKEYVDEVVEKSEINPLDSVLTNTFKQVAFATKVKIVAALLLNKSFNYIYTDRFKESFLPLWAMTGREFLQKLGTDAVRFGLHKDAWAIALFEEFKPNSKWIITDSRFLNELSYVDKYKSIKLNVFRPRILKVSFNKDMSELFYVIDINRKDKKYILEGCDKYNQGVLLTASFENVYFFKEDNHESEIELDTYENFNEIIINRSKEHLFNEAKRIVENYIKI